MWPIPPSSAPHELQVNADIRTHAGELTLAFHCAGRVGAAFHLFDRLRLDHIPRHYTVDAGEDLADVCSLRIDDGRYNLWVYDSAGFPREFRGTLMTVSDATPEV